MGKRRDRPRFVLTLILKNNGLGEGLNKWDPAGGATLLS